MCPICGEGKEEVRNLFVFCDQGYRVWVKMAKLWSMNYVRVGDVATDFDVWFQVFPRGHRDRIWKLAFITLV